MKNQIKKLDSKDENISSGSSSDSDSELKSYIIYGTKIILMVLLGLFLLWMASIPVFVGFRLFIDPKFSLGESYAITSILIMAYVVYKYKE